MSFGTLALHLDGGPATTGRTEFALRLAKGHGSHLVGLAVTGNDAFETSLGAGLLPRAELNEALAAARRHAEVLANAFTDQAAGAGLPSHEAAIDDRDAATALFTRSLYADLMILGRPEPHAPARNWTRRDFERTLLGLVTPAIVLPPSEPPAEIGRRIVVAWKPEPPCAHALAGALPMLRRADQVTLLHVERPFDDVLHVPAREDLERIGARLRRDGVTASARLVQSADDPSGVLLEEIGRSGADLLVMGAGGRRHWPGRALGDCTQALLAGLAVAAFLTP